MVPVLINVRDRLTCLDALVGWLERADADITLLDNDSSYPPLLDYLAETSHQVIYLGQNMGAQALWHAQLVPGEPFIYTDPDVLPIDECPLDALPMLVELLDEYPDWPKVGLGLYLDDVPEDLPSLDWERTLSEPGRRTSIGHYRSLIDTTLAAYRGGSGFAYEAIRTGHPYLMRHATWYMKPPFDEEHTYYLNNAMCGPGGSSWKQEVIAQ